VASPDLVLYNTLTRRKEPFVPLAAPTVRIYLCGLTVYDEWHMGHALQAILFDAFRRYLKRRGYRVVFANNFTDIDDKIIARAARDGVPWKQVSERYIDAYIEDIGRLNLDPADHCPRATENIGPIQELITRLLAGGHAYEAGGNVLFDVASFPAYGALSGIDPAQGQSGEEGEGGEGPGPGVPVAGRRHPADFTMWKAAKPGEPSWESPWGPGRPGWHIECSAMASRFLGTPFDIHAGGLDLIFPHHENEKAQSEAADGRTFARYWMHNGLLKLRGEKMSKSLGNILSVRSLLASHSPNALRHFVLSSHYRSPAEFEPKLLADSAKALERVTNLLDRIEAYRKRPAQGAAVPGAPAASGSLPVTPFSSASEDPSPSMAEGAFFQELLAPALDQMRERFEACLADDFNTAGALGAVFELVGDANAWLQQNEKLVHNRHASAILADVAGAIRRAMEGLGFLPLAPAAAETGLVEPLVQLLIELRNEARRRRDFSASDRIRDRLAELGIDLKDSPEGTRFVVRARSAGAGPAST
jgi:cysteinyl-tRNA synthetase